MPIAHALRAFAVGVLALVVLGDCVTARLIKDPTAPGPEWSVYSSALTGVAIALPKSWKVFDLASDGTHTAAVAWAKGDARATSVLEPGVERVMRDGRARFFAVDTDPAVGGPQASAAYVVRLADPPMASTPSPRTLLRSPVGAWSSAGTSKAMPATC
jgi:hypothetical protein